MAYYFASDADAAAMAKLEELSAAQAEAFAAVKALRAKYGVRAVLANLSYVLAREAAEMPVGDAQKRLEAGAAAITRCKRRIDTIAQGA